MKTTGERIRFLRLRHKLTLDDVAKYLGVGRQAIYKYEQGTVTNIPLDNIEKMAALFGTTPCYLAGWSDLSEEPLYLTTDERLIIDIYRSLSPKGQSLLLDRGQELSVLHSASSNPDASSSDRVV